MSKRALHQIYPYRWDWSAQPFLRMLIGLIIGIGLYNYLQIRTPILFAVLGGSIFLYYVLLIKELGYEYRLVYGIMIHSMVILLGYTSAAYQHGIKDDHHFSHYIDDGPVEVMGLITGIKERTNGYEAVVKISQITPGNTVFYVSGNLNTYISYDDVDATLAIGQHISFNSVIGIHREPKNPEVFDYGAFLRNKHIYHGSKSVNNVEVLSVCTSPMFLISRHRDRLLRSLHDHIDDQKNYAIAASIILGYRDDVDYDTKKAFAETGSIHILAVSGMHVGIIFAVLGLLINQISKHRKIYRYLKIALSLIGIWGFVLLAGAPPSAIRAAFLFTIILFSGLMPGKSNLYHRLATAAFAMLWWNTNYLFDVGFQLSFMAILGIAAFGPIWQRIHEPSNYFKRALYDGTGLTIGATLGTMPLTIYYFHYFPITGLFSSVVVVYFAVIILHVGVLFLMCFWLSALFPFMNTILDCLGGLLNLIVGGLQTVVAFIHSIPFGLITGISISIVSVVLLYSLFVSVRMLLKDSRKKIFVYGVVISFLGLGVMSFTTKWQNAGLNQIVIYHDYKHNTIEVLNGRSATLISDLPVEDRKANFIYSSFNQKRQINEKEAYLSTASIVRDNFAYHDGALKYGDVEILFVEDMSDTIGMEAVYWDYVVLVNNSNVTMNDLFHNLTFDQVVFGASNWGTVVDQWVQSCEDKEIDYIDIRGTKALVIDVNKEIRKIF